MPVGTGASGSLSSHDDRAALSLVTPLESGAEARGSRAARSARLWPLEELCGPAHMSDMKEWSSTYTPMLSAKSLSTAHVRRGDWRIRAVSQGGKARRGDKARSWGQSYP